jgi:dihydrofolate synthase / folylpolyglutamate synthase
MNKAMDYNQALDWIHSLARFGSNPGLERIGELMHRLGNPQHTLKCAHIAGTNGKGSTAAFLASMLEAHGCRTALYTSPYLESFTNRMAINGDDVDRERLAQLVSQVRPHVEAIAATPLGQPTEFEVVTALAFLYFAAEQPDWVVVEVGLGGRLDATNVINPVACAITNIGLEHTQVLGDTIGEIAFEKGGIIKSGVPVVTAARRPEALEVFRRLCAERNAPLYELGSQLSATPRSASLDGQTFDYRSPWHSLDGLSISMLGEHQVDNAALAVALLELLPLPFSVEAVRRGLRGTRWPGRLEVFSQQPLVLVDGAHNLDGIRALRRALETLLEGRKLHLVLGILADKAVDEILAEIAPLATAGLVVTRPDVPRASNPREVAAMAAGHVLPGVPVKWTESVPEAVRLALADTGVEEALCISGSLYTISEARQTLKTIYTPDQNGSL